MTAQQIRREAQHQNATPTVTAALFHQPAADSAAPSTCSGTTALAPIPGLRWQPELPPAHRVLNAKVELACQRQVCSLCRLPTPEQHAAETGLCRALFSPAAVQIRMLLVSLRERVRLRTCVWLPHCLCLARMCAVLHCGLNFSPQHAIDYSSRRNREREAQRQMS